MGLTAEREILDSYFVMEKFLFLLLVFLFPRIHVLSFFSPLRGGILLCFTHYKIVYCSDLTHPWLLYRMPFILAGWLPLLPPVPSSFVPPCHITPGSLLSLVCVHPSPSTPGHEPLAGEEQPSGSQTLFCFLYQ